MKLGLDRVRALLDALGAPDRAYPSLLVAGTNGKGSTCAFAESLLRAAGRRTGLYTSPHLNRFTERIRVDGVEIGRDDVVRLYEAALAAAARVAVEPTFFELTTVMALSFFAEARVAVAVLEVGLGGRLDATNATEPVVSGIAPVDLDHLALLGPTVVDIAREKAGVMRAGRPTWSARQRPEVREVLLQQAGRVGAELRFVDEIDVPLGLRGAHQRGNAALAVALVRAMGVEVDERALAATRWPARYEWFDDARVLIDGAHNAHGATALGRALATDARVSDAPRVVWVVAASNGRDAGELVPAVLGAGARRPELVVATRGRVAGAVPGHVVAAQLKARGLEVVATESTADALGRARELAGEGGVVVAWGSLYAVGEVRALLTGEDRDPVALSG